MVIDRIDVMKRQKGRRKTVGKIEQDGWMTLYPKIGDPQSPYQRVDARFERVFRKNAKRYMEIWQEFRDDEAGSDLPRS